MKITSLIDSRTRKRMPGFLVIGGSPAMRCWLIASALILNLFRVEGLRTLVKRNRRNLRKCCREFGGSFNSWLQGFID